MAFSDYVHLIGVCRGYFGLSIGKLNINNYNESFAGDYINASN